MPAQHMAVTVLLVSERAQETPRGALRLIVSDAIKQLGVEVLGRLRQATPSRTGRARRAWEADTRLVAETDTRLVYQLRVNNPTSYIQYLTRAIASQIARRVGRAGAFAYLVGGLGAAFTDLTKDVFLTTELLTTYGLALEVVSHTADEITVSLT